MSARSVVKWYGVCDKCGAEDDDSRLTEEEARDRMWPDDQGRELCWDCLNDRDPITTEPNK